MPDKVVAENAFATALARRGARTRRKREPLCGAAIESFPGALGLIRVYALHINGQELKSKTSSLGELLDEESGREGFVKLAVLH